MEIVEYKDKLWHVINWKGFTFAADAMFRNHGYKNSSEFFDLEVSKWFDKNMEGRWFYHTQFSWIDDSPSGYYFELKSDALLFKLTWHISEENPKMPIICSGKRSAL